MEFVERNANREVHERNDNTGGQGQGYARGSGCIPKKRGIEKRKIQCSYTGFHGKQTASGEIFNQNDYTCAHKSLPFGTKLKVVRDDTGASVVVRVNDRGPYVDGRILDLSVAAGKDIGLDKVGHAKVTATVIE